MSDKTYQRIYSRAEIERFVREHDPTPPRTDEAAVRYWKAKRDEAIWAAKIAASLSGRRKDAA